MILPVRHGGNIHNVAQAQGKPLGRLIDFSASINPLGLSPVVRRAIQQSIPDTIHYPDRSGQQLRKGIAVAQGISEDLIVLGNGSAELITVLPRALGSQHGLVIGPTFMEFERALILTGAQCTYVHARKDARYQSPIDDVCQMLLKQGAFSGKKRKAGSRGLPIDTVFLCNPNSPTGHVCSRSRVRQLLNVVQKTKISLIVDEAFIDYCASHSMLQDVDSMKRLIVLRSFTKFYAMPGLRLGYLVGPSDVVSHVVSLLPPWSVNTLAHNAALAALRDTVYPKKCVEFMRRERTRFRRQLQRLPGLQVYPSSTNFLLVELSVEYQVPVLVQILQEEGLLIRDCQSFSGIHAPTIRLAVRRVRENNRLVRALKWALPACR